ncbi:ABC transporter permease [Ohtaekwangia koreensis]|uniref:ABC transporter permease n=1 Tax=Ohtaekwangia koreensis TaxID=688867 RepID=UPI00117D755D|nr:ABC transporter permease [Ohtaekwangia koreensis]
MKHSIKPPRLADRIFTWYCDTTSMEDLHGDLEELFNHDLEYMSVRRAKLKYWQRVASLLFSYAVKKRKQKAAHHHYAFTSFHPAMLKNYFLIGIRSLSKHRFFTIVNVLGLAVGMSISLLLIAFMSFLWRYDTFHVNKDRMYRVISVVTDKQRTDPLATAPVAVAQKLRDEYTGIDEVVRINSTLTAEASYKDKEIPLEGYYVDSNFLQVFTFPLLKGNIATVLSKPNSMIITEAAGVKMFNAEDPIGKVITMDEKDFEITGILKNVPKNSHMQFEVLASYQTLLQSSQANSTQSTDSWVDFRKSYIYLLLPAHHNTEAIEAYLNKVSAPIYAKEKNLRATFELQALNDIAPGRDLRYSIGPAWDYASLSIFIFLTILILLPACFNYANISISRALKRMKEIGLRKVMGGQRDQIFLQFIMETVIIAMIALVFAYYIFTLVRSEFLSMLADRVGMDLSTDFYTIAYFILFALFVGLVAGIIPALYFARLTPIQALKTKPVSKGFSGISFRKVLIVSQFALSLGFIMGVVVVLNQYRHSLNHDFGFDQENILDVELQSANPQILRNEFAKLVSVQSISMSSHIAGTGASESIWLKDLHVTDSTEVYQMFVDERYISNLNLSLLAGNNFTEDIAQNKKHAIVNEEFLKTFGIKDPAHAIGQSYVLPGGDEITVSGVVKNFHYMPLRYPIKSFFFRYDSSRFQYANIKMVTTDVFTSITEMESAWKMIAGEDKFTAQFFDDEIKATYAFYFVMVKMCGFLGLLAITISCLGLLGMVVFTVENRVKEVGIRKVMGASTTSIIVILSKDFMKLMSIAALIAIPLAYLFFDQVFVRMQYYHVPVGILEIVISLSLMFLLGLATIFSQTIRAARANPVDTLKCE